VSVLTKAKPVLSLGVIKKRQKSNFPSLDYILFKLFIIYYYTMKTLFLYLTNPELCSGFSDVLIITCYYLLMYFILSLKYGLLGKICTKYIYEKIANQPKKSIFVCFILVWLIPIIVYLLTIIYCETINYVAGAVYISNSIELFNRPVITAILNALGSYVVFATAIKWFTRLTRFIKISIGLRLGIILNFVTLSILIWQILLDVITLNTDTAQFQNGPTTTELDFLVNSPLELLNLSSVVSQVLDIRNLLGIVFYLLSHLCIILMFKFYFTQPIELQWITKYIPSFGIGLDVFICRWFTRYFALLQSTSNFWVAFIMFTRPVLLFLSGCILALSHMAIHLSSFG
jgi:hypothetical protein